MSGATRAAAAVIAVGAAGCAVLPAVTVPVDGAAQQAAETLARIAVDTRHPVVVHGVDGTDLGVQVSNALRPVHYLLPPGPHRLRVSSAPAGLPWLPQRISCYLLEATFTAGDYTLRFDETAHAPLLLRQEGGPAVAQGWLVDAPLVMQRRCQWPP